MTWNYRIIKKDVDYSIHEVYYTEDGKPEMVTVEPIAPYGETYIEFLGDFGYYLDAITKPVLNFEDIPSE